MRLLQIGSPVQIAYAVSDAQSAAKYWATHFGAGPFVIREHIALNETRVNGASGVFDHSSAYGQWGDVMVELVQQHQTPIIGAAVGLHHCAYFVSDFDAAQKSLTDAGFPELLRAKAEGGTEFAFHDARASLGHLIEIYERTLRLVAFYEHIRSLAS